MADREFAPDRDTTDREDVETIRQYGAASLRGGIACARLMKAHSAYLDAYIGSRTQRFNKHDRDDVVQAVWTHFLDKLALYDPDTALRAWLTHLAKLEITAHKSHYLRPKSFKTSQGLTVPVRGQTDEFYFDNDSKGEGGNEQSWTDRYEKHYDLDQGSSSSFTSCHPVTFQAPRNPEQIVIEQDALEHAMKDKNMRRKIKRVFDAD